MPARSAPTECIVDLRAWPAGGELVLRPPVAQRTRRRRVNLSTLEVARELGYLYRRVDRGELPSAEAGRRTYMLQTLGKVLETAVLERRLDALEKAHGVES